MGLIITLLILGGLVHWAVGRIGAKYPEVGNAISKYSKVIAVALFCLWCYKLTTFQGKSMPLGLIYLALIFAFMSTKRRFPPRAKPSAARKPNRRIAS